MDSLQLMINMKIVFMQLLGVMQILGFLLQCLMMEELLLILYQEMKNIKLFFKFNFFSLLNNLNLFDKNFSCELKRREKKKRKKFIKEV